MNKTLFDKLRKEKHMTLECLSEKTGISVSTLTKISAGYVETSFKNMCLIAKALECSLDDFTENQAAISKEDRKLLKKYHQLTRSDQDAVQTLLHLNLHHQQENSQIDEQTFPINPAICQKDYLSSCNYMTKPILVPPHTMLSSADLAVKISFEDFAPVFRCNDILYLHCRLPKAGDIGMFENQERIFFGRRCAGNEELRLKSIQFPDDPERIYDLQTLTCWGTVYAIQRNNLEVGIHDLLD